MKRRSPAWWAGAVWLLLAAAGVIDPQSSTAQSPPVPAAPDSGGTVHRVAPGETLYRIANRYAVPLEVLQQFNEIDDPTRLGAGDELSIPPVYVVRKGDTVYSIGRRFSVPARAILDANGIDDPTAMAIGALLLIPVAMQAAPGAAAFASPSAASAATGTATAAATAAARAATAATGEHRLWPLHGPRQRLTGKLEGVVIAGEEGTPVLSVSSGVVRWASASRGYGQVVFVQNPLGYIYGYLGSAETFVSVGDQVEVGTELGTLGRNPVDEQTNLYFLVFKNGRAVDPVGAPRV